MLFNSIDFAVFLPVVFVLYWSLNGRSLKLQNLFIVAASYTFYGWWDWRYLSLVIISTVAGYGSGQGIARARDQHTRRLWLLASIVVNLGLLAFFKYFNFFAESFSTAFTFFGGEISARPLRILLPIGISFYTFQTLSYSIDVYRGRIEPTPDYVAFSAFHSFFPQLVAGPIERATTLLPQFLVRRRFQYAEAVDGLRQILWGMFKKVVIADSCARYADTIFNDSSQYPGSTLLLGALFFTFQIYGDFSGYSDIALGTAKLFGFRLMQNFAFPYFSRDIAEFWRRWHISLSTWFRDYLYVPLGGSRGSTWMTVRNVFIIFLVSGFWHGANWTFLVWGALHALYYLPVLLLGRNRRNLEVVAKGRLLPSPGELGAMAATFSLTVLAWIFFRAESVAHALSYVAGIFSPSLLTVPGFAGDSGARAVIGLVIAFMLIEWLGREGNYAIERVGFRWARPLRWGFYSLIILLIIGYSGAGQQFIYFQF